MEPNTFTTPVTAELARALAQAAEGYYGPELYFTASFWPLPDTSDPYDISHAFASAEDAANSLQQSPPLAGYGVFGPFVNQMVGIGSPPNDQVRVTELEVTTTSGSTFVISSASVGGMPDAIFLTAEAVQKFAVPYYSIVYATGFGHKLLETFNQSELAMMVHLPWSESENLNDLGQPEEFKLVPGAQVEVIEGAGHSPQVEKPEEVANLILAFAAGKSAAPEKKKPAKKPAD